MRIGRATVVLFTLWVSVAPAQLLDNLKKTPQERAETQTAYMKSALGLTPDQIPKVQALNLEYAQKMDPIVKGSGRPADKMREMSELAKEKDGKLEQILTPEQFTKYQAAKAEIRRQMTERPRPLP